MLNIHKQQRAKAFLDVWALRSFSAAPADYENSSRKAAELYPFNELPVGR
jgi:hypothetical protein